MLRLMRSADPKGFPNTFTIQGFKNVLRHLTILPKLVDLQMELYHQKELDLRIPIVNLG